MYDGCFAQEDDLEILPNDKYELGDANTDGVVNVKDSTAIQKHIVGLEYLNSLQLSLSDVNGDDYVNVRDATMIQKIIAGLVVPTTPDTSVVSTNTEATDDDTPSEVSTVPSETPAETEATTQKPTRDPNKPVELPFVPAL